MTIYHLHSAAMKEIKHCVIFTQRHIKSVLSELASVLHWLAALLDKEHWSKCPCHVQGQANLWLLVVA